MLQHRHIKGWSSALAAVLLAAWYLLSVVGLDVHQDREHGATYVVCGLSGGNCEVIHPEHHCHDCDHDADGACMDGEDCCSDDFEAVLSVGGAPDAPVVPAATVGALALLPGASAAPVASPCRIILRLHAPPPGGGDLLSRICVLRA